MQVMAQKRSRRDYEADLRKREAPFVVYGTPLPTLDDNARDDGSYLPLWKQEVTDDRGRKRLHGAFTGGFSAGYFNTVGSKEGWIPASFVSSRANRAKDSKSAKPQTVDDFMDDEDIKERDDAQQISTNDEFAGFGTGHVQGALDDIFRPRLDSVGEQLLNKMGWKKGQGIGPRLVRKIDPGDPGSESREFPPEDGSMLEFSPQQGTQGLGSSGSDVIISQRPSITLPSATQGTSNHVETRPGLSFMDRTKPTAQKTLHSGFGVGSLNDNGSDDEDFYEIGPKVTYIRAMGGDRKAKKTTSVATSSANPLLKTKPVFTSKAKQLPSALKSLNKCHDGKLPLAGFVLAEDLDSFSSMSLSDPKYQPPEVPQTWVPAALTSSAGSQDAPPDGVGAVTQSNLTPVSRRHALAEPSLPSKSVFDFISPAARDRLVCATQNPNLPPALNEAPPAASSASAGDPFTPLPYTHLDSITASTALERLRRVRKADAPYAEDLAKQGRYKDYLRYSTDMRPAAQRIPPLRAPHHNSSDEAHLTEVAEFAATAELFKPATGFLASRFTTAASPEASVDDEERSRQEAMSNLRPGTEELLTKPTSKAADPAEEAAKMGMFGTATQSTKGWMPTRLVCKRFGIDMPVDFNE